MPWTDDDGHPRINRGFRVQYSSTLGPFFGGTRFASGVSLSLMRQLAFESTLQHALSPFPLGGARGGSDFSPVGKSPSEIRNFCQSYMREVSQYVGPHTDIPIGDLGVGEREMSLMYGAYKDHTKRADAAMGAQAAMRRYAARMSKAFDGSEAADAYKTNLTREHATGLGCVLFAQRALAERGESLEVRSSVLLIWF